MDIIEFIQELELADLTDEEIDRLIINYLESRIQWESGTEQDNE